MQIDIFMISDVRMFVKREVTYRLLDFMRIIKKYLFINQHLQNYVHEVAFI